MEKVGDVMGEKDLIRLEKKNLKQKEKEELKELKKENN